MEEITNADTASSTGDAKSTSKKTSSENNKRFLEKKLRRQKLRRHRQHKKKTKRNSNDDDDDDDDDDDYDPHLEKEPKKVRTKKGAGGKSCAGKSLSSRTKKKYTTTAVGGGRRATTTSTNTRYVGKKKSTRTADALGSTKRAKKAPIDSTRAGERLDSLKGEYNELGATYSNAVAGWKKFFDEMRLEHPLMSYNQILELFAELSCNEGVKINTLNTFCLDRGITRPLDPNDGRKNNNEKNKLVKDGDRDEFIMKLAEKCMDENENKKDKAVEAVNKYGFVTRAAKEKFPQLRGGDKASCWMRKNKLQDKILKKIGEMKAEEASGKFKSLFG